MTTKRFFFQDSLGNTSHLSDEAGNLLERYTYSAFGMPSFYNAAGTLISASTKGTRHLFQGQLWTQQTGLNDYRNRVEHPIMGVFLQPDPIGFKGDAANLYRFCTNNAVNRIDPLGLGGDPIGDRMWNTACFFDSGNSFQGSWEDFNNRNQAGMGENAGGGPTKSIASENEGKKAGMAEDGNKKSYRSVEDRLAAGEEIQVVAGTTVIGPGGIARAGGLLRGLLAKIFGRSAPNVMPRTASQIMKWAEGQGWVRIQTATGPVKYIDGNGVVRATIKQGSSRAPGSSAPHVELRNASGQRVDPAGNVVTRKSPDNHTPIEWDLP